MVYVIPMCIGSALSALVGAAMGEGDAKAAIKIT
jgi:Na+-driven multidrug efflux pump